MITFVPIIAVRGRNMAATYKRIYELYRQSSNCHQAILRS